MSGVAITGSGVFTPEDIITNDELVAAFNAYAALENARHAEEISAGTRPALEPSSAAFIRSASGIEQRHVLDKKGVLDPEIMHPTLRPRSDTEPGAMAEIALKAAQTALAEAGRAPKDIGAVICAASNHERAYPAIAVEIQDLLGIRGFGFDMNVACSSATFGIQAAADMIRGGSVSSVLMVNPEICSAHLEWRDRDCHFIFGDVATAVVLERAEAASGPAFEILATKCTTQFSNNIRNNNGFWRDMLFMQEGRRVFREVVPIVTQHIADQLLEAGVAAQDLRRLWLPQANKTMNDLIGKKVLGRVPEAGEQPNILQHYANTSSAGSIIAFSQHSADLQPGDLGLICSFGAGYSVGSVLLRRVT